MAWGPADDMGLRGISCKLQDRGCYGTVLYGVSLRCGTVWCGMVWYGTVMRHGAVLYRMVPYGQWHGMANGMAKTAAESRLSHNRTEPSQG